MNMNNICERKHQFSSTASKRLGREGPRSFQQASNNWVNRTPMYTVPHPHYYSENPISSVFYFWGHKTHLGLSQVLPHSHFTSHFPYRVQSLSPDCGVCTDPPARTKLCVELKSAATCSAPTRHLQVHVHFAYVKILQLLASAEIGVHFWQAVFLASLKKDLVFWDTILSAFQSYYLSVHLPALLPDLPPRCKSEPGLLSQPAHFPWGLQGACVVKRTSLALSLCMLLGSSS